LPYGYLAHAMADIRDLSFYHGLDVTNFDAAEPVHHEVQSGYFVETRVSATFVGDKISQFVYGLYDSNVFVRVLHIDFLEDGAEALRVELSFFGRGQ